MAFDDGGGWAAAHLVSMADWALERWSTFPVDSKPRPLVLVESMARAEGGGFRSVVGKAAFMRGDVEPNTEVPDSVLRVIREQGNPEHHVGGHNEPLLITAASHEEAAFRTDRGSVELPAWRLEGPEIVGVLRVLDPEVAQKAWRLPGSADQPPPLPGSPFRSSGSWTEADGTTLHFIFSGSPEEYTEYDASDIRESRQAVAVIPIGHDVGPTGARRAIGQRRDIVVHLKDRLGARVLINLDSSPVAVEQR